VKNLEAKKVQRASSPFSEINFNVKALKNGAEKGYCRICGKYGPLTDDHVPPKSCGNKGRIVFSIGKNKLILQNGFHCRTICSKCNNELLGCDLDKEYKKAFDKINNFKKSGLYLPRNILEIDVDIKKFFRSIIAHFLSVAVYEKGMTIQQVLESPIHDDFISENCRAFVLGQEENPKNVDLYYWYYPFSNIYVNPSVSFSMDLLKINESTILGAMMKFFPIAVFILNKKVSTASPPGIKVNFDKDKIFLDMKHIMHKEVFEHPTETGFIIHSPNNTVDGVKNNG